MSDFPVINRNIVGGSKCRGVCLTIVAGLVVLLLAACSGRDKLPPEAEGKLVVVATIFPLADWAREVGGERVYVSTLLPPGASPHTFDPGPKEMRLISHSSLFLKAGLHMDDWGAGLASSNKSSRTISVGDELLKNGKLPDVSHLGTEEVRIEGAGDEHGHEHGNVNPHFWLDPKLAEASVEQIRDGLITADPDSRSIYEQNASKYLDELRSMDAELTKKLEPLAGSGFVSFHNAWPYFAHRYHLKILAVIEEYAGKAPSERYLRSLTDKLKSLNVKTVFSEPQLSPAVAQVIASEVGGDVRVLDPYGTEKSTDRNSYISTMQYNATQLIQALQPLQK